MHNLFKEKYKKEMFLYFCARELIIRNSATGNLKTYFWFFSISKDLIKTISCGGFGRIKINNEQPINALESFISWHEIIDKEMRNPINKIWVYICMNIHIYT